MFRTVILITLFTTAAVVALVDDSVPDPARPPRRPEQVTVTYPSELWAPSAPATAPLDDYQQGLVSWAKGRYAEAGLELPELTVEFDPTREACGGAEGIYRYDGRTHRIAICTREGSSFASDLLRRRTLLHELAHAWETVTFDDDRRAALNQRFGTEAWADADDEWSDRGAEQLAETVVFGLLDQTHRELKIDRSCGALADDFIAVTGSAVLGPDLPWCLR